jgi:hypothetical protein
MRAPGRSSTALRKTRGAKAERERLP